MLRKDVTFEVRGIDEEKRQATFVASTERAVPMWEGPEVLRMKGCKLERYKKNPVLLNSHGRYRLEDLIGSCEAKVVGRELHATATYADTRSGSNAWKLVKGGHCRAMSIGYQVNPKKVRRLREGERDGDVEGPAVIVDEWTLLEISNVAVPADEDAVRRQFYESIPHGKEKPMIKGVNYEAAVGERSASPAEDENEVETTERAAPAASTPRPTAKAKTEETRDERLLRAQRAVTERVKLITPKGLEQKAEEALRDLSDDDLLRGVGFDIVRAALKVAQAERFKPVGTTEPTPVQKDEAEGKDEERAEKPLPESVDDDVIVRSFENLS